MITRLKDGGAPSISTPKTAAKKNDIKTPDSPTIGKQKNNANVANITPKTSTHSISQVEIFKKQVPVTSTPEKASSNSITNFDADYYLANNPDVKGAVDKGNTTAKQHFRNHGMKEGRIASAKHKELYDSTKDFPFDKKYYLQQNPDVKKAIAKGDTTAEQHFIDYGIREGRYASQAHQDGKTTAPLVTTPPNETTVKAPILGSVHVTIDTTPTIETPVKGDDARPFNYQQNGHTNIAVLKGSDEGVPSAKSTETSKVNKEAVSQEEKDTNHFSKLGVEIKQLIALLMGISRKLDAPPANAQPTQTVGAAPPPPPPNHSQMDPFRSMVQMHDPRNAPPAFNFGGASSPISMGMTESIYGPNASTLTRPPSITNIGSLMANQMAGFESMRQPGMQMLGSVPMSFAPSGAVPNGIGIPGMTSNIQSVQSSPPGVGMNPQFSPTPTQTSRGLNTTALRTVIDMMLNYMEGA